MSYRHTTQCSVFPFQFLWNQVLMLLHADVFLMQNYEHVARVVSLLNEMPKETRDTDFSRVRSYHLDGLGARLRQTVNGT